LNWSWGVFTELKHIIVPVLGVIEKPSGQYLGLIVMSH
jgi:hypothetical protein